MYDTNPAEWKKDERTIEKRAHRRYARERQGMGKRGYANENTPEEKRVKGQDGGRGIG